MRRRRAVVILVAGTALLALFGGSLPTLIQQSLPKHYVLLDENKQEQQAQGSAADALNQLLVKGRAPKTGYERNLFGNGWSKVNGCSTRDIILYRDLTNTVLEDECSVLKGTLEDPYTAELIQFSKTQSSDVQIDHVVALSDAWQKGAQQLSIDKRKELANDPLNLLATQGIINQQKSDGDAATWLPPNKSFRCSYIARQVAVKQKYNLWVTAAEKDAMTRVLESCPGQILPAI